MSSSEGPKSGSVADRIARVAERLVGGGRGSDVEVLEVFWMRDGERWDDPWAEYGEVRKEDFFRDQGDCLKRRYAGEAEADAAIRAQYKGSDANGVGLGWTFRRVDG